mmetsp:Transcript_30834/g.79186  ORF Transcript_30834/g.79186 Transcript_30834/m.79186 type:complete len:548 (-) Transcript_30834:63-1706(-)
MPGDDGEQLVVVVRLAPARVAAQAGPVRPAAGDDARHGGRVRLDLLFQDAPQDPRAQIPLRRRVQHPDLLQAGAVDEQHVRVGERDGHVVARRHLVPDEPLKHVQPKHAAAHEDRALRRHDAPPHDVHRERLVVYRHDALPRRVRICLETRAEVHDEAATAVIQVLEQLNVLDELAGGVRKDLPAQVWAHLVDDAVPRLHAARLAAVVEVVPQLDAQLAVQVVLVHEAPQLVHQAVVVAAVRVAGGHHAGERRHDVAQKVGAQDHQAARKVALRVRHWHQVPVAHGRQRVHREVEGQRVHEEPGLNVIHLAAGLRVGRNKLVLRGVPLQPVLLPFDQHPAVAVVAELQLEHGEQPPQARHPVGQDHRHQQKVEHRPHAVVDGHRGLHALHNPPNAREPEQPEQGRDPRRQGSVGLDPILQRPHDEVERHHAGEVDGKAAVQIVQHDVLPAPHRHLALDRVVRDVELQQHVQQEHPIQQRVADEPAVPGPHLAKRSVEGDHKRGVRDAQHHHGVPDGHKGALVLQHRDDPQPEAPRLLLPLLQVRWLP